MELGDRTGSSSSSSEPSKAFRAPTGKARPRVVPFAAETPGLDGPAPSCLALWASWLVSAELEASGTTGRCPEAGGTSGLVVRTSEAASIGNISTLDLRLRRLLPVTHDQVRQSPRAIAAQGGKGT